MGRWRRFSANRTTSPALLGDRSLIVHTQPSERDTLLHQGQSAACYASAEVRRGLAASIEIADHEKVALETPALECIVATIPENENP